MKAIESAKTPTADKQFHFGKALEQRLLGCCYTGCLRRSQINIIYVGGAYSQLLFVLYWCRK